MSTKVSQQPTLTLSLEEPERAELLQMLQQALRETRVEAHRTHTPDFRDQVLGREKLLRTLIEKLGRPIA